MTKPISSLNELLQIITTGLIYPAVLGNIIYLIFITVNSWTTYLNDPHFLGKFVLLIITTFFYIADFIYILLTRNFKWWMLLCDILFLISLFLTIHNINLSIESLSTPISWSIIILCYIGFFFLYLIWDLIEWKLTNIDSETLMYKRIVWWEGVSISILAFILLGPISESAKDIVNNIAIALITIGFYIINALKFKSQAMVKNQ